MANFKRWLEEAKKKGTKESLPPTATSSPIRGANQDQSGYNGKNNVADYTISDEKQFVKVKEDVPVYDVDGKRVSKPKTTTVPAEKKINEVSAELVGKVNKSRLDKPSKTPAAAKILASAVRKKWLASKVGVVKEGEKQLELEGPDSWEQHTPSERKRTVKDLLKLGSRHGAEEMPHLKIKESSMVSAIGNNRIKPVNLGQTTGGIGEKDPNAPNSASQLQNAANQRVVQLDQAAQKEKDNARKEREKEIAKRQKEAAAREKTGAK